MINNRVRDGFSLNLEMAKNLKALKEILTGNPNETLKDFEKLQKDISLLIKSIGDSKESIATALGMKSRVTLYKRLKDPKLWTAEEIKLVIKKYIQ